jgi:hypothetical protein
MEYRLISNLEKHCFEVAKFYKKPDGSMDFITLPLQFSTEFFAKQTVKLYNSDLEIVKGLCVRSFEWNAFLQDPNKSP